MSNRKRHRDYEYFLDIQNILTNYLSEGIKPSLQKLQERHFGIHYDFDSKYQKDMVRRAIEIGRKYALRRWISYTDSKDFREYSIEIQEKYPKLIEKELASEEYLDYLEFLNDPNLPKERKLELEETNVPVIAVIFKEKIIKYSKLKENLVITKGGRGARWYLPVYWDWCIREDKLIIRKYVTLMRGITRIIGAKTTVRLETQELIEIQRSRIPALEDGLNWRCPSCGSYNLRTRNHCTTCNKPKALEDV